MIDLFLYQFDFFFNDFYSCSHICFNNLCYCVSKIFPIRLPSFWSLVASITFSIKSSLTSSFIISIFSGSVSTIAGTLTDNDCFSSATVLLTSSLLYLQVHCSHCYNISDTLAIFCGVFCFLIAEIVSFST